jgi:outer membrane biosynthesis protein TonB
MWSALRQSINRRRKTWNTTLWIAAAFSLLLHLVLFFSVATVEVDARRNIRKVKLRMVEEGRERRLAPDAGTDAPSPRSPRPVFDVVAGTPQGLAEIEDETEEPVAPPPPDEVAGTEEPAGLIVTLLKPEKEEMPEHARFASRYAVKVDEEVRARRASKDQNVPDRWSREKAKGTHPTLKKGDSETDSAGGGLQDPGAREGAAGIGPGLPKDGGRYGPAGTGSGRQGDGSGASGEGEGPAGTGSGSEGGRRRTSGSPFGLPGGLSLIPPDMAGRDPVRKYSFSSSPYASDDYIPDVEKEGDTNILNSIPFRYAGFFERVKSAVRAHWDPNRVYNLRDPTGQIYAQIDRFTTLSIVLDDSGRILESSVEAQSGLKFLDDEALRAFWAAGPFLNPPRGLIDQGRIRFRFHFGFLIASGGPSFDWSL